MRPDGGIFTQGVDRLCPLRRRVEPVLCEVIEYVLWKLLALSGQPVLHLGLVGEEDLLHALQDHFISLGFSADTATAKICRTTAAAAVCSAIIIT